MMTNLLGGASGSDTFLSIDFSSFDASVSPSLSTSAFTWIGQMFQTGAISGFEDVVERFINIPIHTPDGDYTGPHGVPSGSTFTNTVDSAVQWLIAEGAIQNLSNRCQIQGDDGVYVLPRNEIDVLLGGFRDAGLKVNEDKTEVSSEYAFYLQRYYSRNYRASGGGLGGVYPISRAANRLKYLERWVGLGERTIDREFTGGQEDQISLREPLLGRDYFSLRAIMILENCKYHPAFFDLVKYAHSLDKYNLDFTKQGIDAFSRHIDPQARAGAMHRPSVSNIDKFETVKAIKQLGG